MSEFQNQQWVIADDHLSTVMPGAPYEYNIHLSRLTEMAGAGDRKVYDWPVHMAEKTWIDMEAFEEAFRKALELAEGQYEPAVDAELLEESFIAGWKQYHRSR